MKLKLQLGALQNELFDLKLRPKYGRIIFEMDFFSLLERERSFK